MRTPSLIAAALLALATLSQVAVAAPTRDEVTADLYRARVNGEICNNEAECDRSTRQFSASATHGASSVPVIGSRQQACRNEAECDAAPRRDFSITRAQVTAELYRARAAGEIAVTEADMDIGHDLQRHHSN